MPGLTLMIVPILAAAAAADEPPIMVTGRSWAPFISPMGEPFRARAAGEDTLARWFNQADRNRDGALTSTEMEADAERFFARLDADGNGQIEPEELVQYEWELAPEIQVASRWKRSRPAASGARASSGETARRSERAEHVPSSDGLAYGLQGAARYALLNIPQPVAAADADFDRAITLGEFRLAARYRFQLLDSRRQGRLTLAGLAELLPSPSKAGRLVKPRKNDTRIGLPLPPGD
ncbi:MAG TPA: EF-hand domain-containing protein [Sphingomicrobium sp.]|nr:EF-hand domain-containing protein [Sphingomicrobium sp.]